MSARRRQAASLRERAGSAIITVALAIEALIAYPLLPPDPAWQDPAGRGQPPSAGSRAGG
jgi:hypothetical protein